MSVNNITDPSFENGNSAWDFSDSGAARAEVVDAHDGDWVARVTLRLGFEDLAGRFGQVVSLFDTSLRRFQFRIRGLAGFTDHEDSRIHVDIYDGVQDITDPNAGDKITGGTFDGTLSEGSWTSFQSDLVNPPTTTATIVVWTEFVGPDPPPFTIFTDVWEIDSFDFPDPFAVLTVAKRRDILDAVLTTLAGITTAGGYNTDVGDIFEGDRKKAAIGEWPAIHVEYGDEIKRHNEFHRKVGDLQLVLFLYCKTTAADKSGAQVADDLAEDVEIILETHQSNQFLGLGYIEDVLVSVISPVEVTEEVHQGVRIWGMQIDIKYRYDRLAP